MTEKNNTVIKTIKALDRYSVNEGFEKVGPDVSILDDACMPKEFYLTRSEWNMAFAIAMDAIPRTMSSQWKLFIELGILKDVSDDGKTARFDVMRAREIHRKSRFYHDE